MRSFKKSGAIFMKRLFVVFVLLCLFPTPSFAQSDDDTCDPYPDVPVAVTPVMEDSTYDYATSIRGLKALESSTPHFYERLLLGVTTFKPVIEVVNYPKTITPANGYPCIKITNVEIKIGYRDVVTHVASEIPQGSCGFNEVVAHEQKHVAVNQQVFQEYVPLIQQKMKEYLKINGIKEQVDYGYTMKVLHDNMKTIVGQIVQEIEKQEQIRQQQVDTDGEFLQMARVCNGQLREIALQFRRTGQ
jgi:hypothetical protein